MRFISTIIVLMLVAIFFSWVSVDNFGRVIIILNHYRIDLSIATAGLIFIISLIILYIILLLIFSFLKFPIAINRWHVNYKILKNLTYLKTAFFYFFEGMYKSSSKYAEKAMQREEKGDNKILANFIALYSNLLEHNLPESKKLLASLQGNTNKKWQLAEFIFSARHYYMLDDFDTAIKFINRALVINNQNILVRIILMRIQIHKGEYFNAIKTYNNMQSKMDYLDLELQKIRFDTIPELFATAKTSEELNNFYELALISGQAECIEKYYFFNIVRLNNFKIAMDKLILWGFEKIHQYKILPACILLAKKTTSENDLNQLLHFFDSILARTIADQDIMVILGIISFNLQHYDDATGYFNSSIAINNNFDSLMYLTLISNINENIDLQEKNTINLIEFLKQ